MKRFSILLASLLLCACFGGANNSVPLAVYDFGMPVSRLSSDNAWSKMALEIKAPHWFDSVNVQYRLAYEDPLKLRNYGGSRWAGSPAELLGQRLRQQLGVAGATGNSAVDCLLRLDLQEFSQVFDAPQSSRAVVHGSVSVFDAKRRIVAARQFAVEQPAVSGDARGGVAALVNAGDELGQQLAGWLSELDKSGGFNACRASAAISVTTAK
jgi:cholesterol transport system auxiliary component